MFGYESKEVYRNYPSNENFKNHTKFLFLANKSKSQAYQSHNVYIKYFDRFMYN